MILNFIVYFLAGCIIGFLFYDIHKLKKQSAKQSKDLTIFTKLANELFNKIQQNINTLNENTVTLEKNIITVHENHKETRTVTNDLRRCCIEFAEMFNILINSETKKIPNLKNKSEKLN